MPFEVKIVGNRSEIIEWLDLNIGKFTSNSHYYAAKGVGWEILPYGMDYGNSLFQEPKRFILRVWDKDKAFLARLRWE